MEEAFAYVVAELEALKTEAEAQPTRVAELEVNLKEVCLLSYILYRIQYCQCSYITIIQPYNSLMANYRKRVSFTMIYGRRRKVITWTGLIK